MCKRPNKLSSFPFYSLLHTVPSDVLEKGNAVADSYRNTEDVEPEILDREMQQLESIL